MRHDFLDRFSRLASPVHRLPSWLKVTAALAVVVIVVSVPGRWHVVFAVAALVLVVVAGVSRIPPAFLLGRLLLLEPFVIGVALLSLLQPGGMRVFLTVLMRSTLCLFTLILLANTTPFAELLRVLRRAGMPQLLVTVLALMYRYVFVLIDERERLQRARTSRSFSPRAHRSWHSMASMAAQLFVRSSERAERIYAAMCSRGWRA
jgi:cobalt/nickel transport system permease protein